MYKLTSMELFNVSGGTNTYTPFDFIYKVYRIVNIKCFMKRVFVD